jgi:hypothetical protein
LAVPILHHGLPVQTAMTKCNVFETIKIVGLALDVRVGVVDVVVEAISTTEVTGGRTK